MAYVLAFLFGVGAFCAFLLWGWKVMIHDVLTPKVYTFPDASELDSEEKRSLGVHLRTHIPESASDIYFFKSRGTYFYSLILLSEEIPKFAEEFAGIPISQFNDGKNHRGPFCKRLCRKRASTLRREVEDSLLES